MKPFKNKNIPLTPYINHVHGRLINVKPAPCIGQPVQAYINTT